MVNLRSRDVGGSARPPPGPPPVPSFGIAHVSREVIDQGSVGRAAQLNRSQTEGRAHTIHSENSSVRIAGLEEQLRTAQAQNEQMRNAMINAGLLREDPIVQEDEAESRVQVVEPVVVGHVAGQVPVRQVVEPRETSFKEFMSFKPAKFKGGDDPVVCKRWIRSMEQVFRSGHFSEIMKVEFASRLLEGEAQDWWAVVEQSVTEAVRNQITWGLFVTKLNQKFCNSGVIQKMEKEFLELKKDAMKIAKYNSVFLEKLQFAGKYCPDEASKVIRYVEGLPAAYKGLVRTKPTLDTAMEEALRVEEDLNGDVEKAVVVGEKRKSEGPSGSRFKKGKFGKKNVQSKDGVCKDCKKKHTGRCDVKDIKCYKCNKMGHYARDCRSEPKEIICYKCGKAGHISTNCPEQQKPDAPRARGRVFHMAATEAAHDEEVICGTFLVNSMSATVLFDSGASRSFVASTFCDKFNKPRSMLACALDIEVAIGNSVMAKDKFED